MSAPSEFHVGAVAVRGNPRNLLTRWPGSKKPRGREDRPQGPSAWAGGRVWARQITNTASLRVRRPPLAVRAALGLLSTRPCLSSIRPELLAIGRERGSDEHKDGQAEDNFAYC
jgi:hypothetical protein